MHTLAVLSLLWIIALAAFVALMVYRSHLTHHHTDELFLADASQDSFRKTQQDVTIRRVNSLRPFYNVAGGLTAALSVAIIGVQVVHALPNIRF